MKHILKGILSLTISIAMAGCLLTGCKNDNSSKSGGSFDKQTEEKREALTISSFNNLITEDFIAAFHQKYPEVNLDIISYAGTNGSGYAMHSLMHGDIPDIYISSQNFDKNAQEEYLLDLSNYDFVNNYSNALLDSVDINGSIYLLPSGYTLTGIYYNKTILKENNWEVPKSFQELCELSEKIEAAGYQTMGNGMSLDGFPFNYFFNIGNTVYFGTPEGTEWKEDFSKGTAQAQGNEGLKKTVEYFNKWVEKGFVSAEHIGTEQFYEGECVFFLCLGLNQYEHTAQNGKTYQFGTIPWLSEDGTNNMLTRNISRYMGISKELEEKGNEEKLEDALKLLNYVSTLKGQQALMSSSSEYMSSLNEAELSENSPYQEIADLVSQGRTVPMVYVGWERLIIPIAQDVKQLIKGETDTDGLIKAFDNTNQSILDGSDDDLYAAASETLTLKQTAELVAAAEGTAVSADCVMISLNKYHGNNMKNNQGLGWYLYQGDITTEVINLIRPKANTISILEMTGKEIKKMQEQGFDLDENGNPYEYLLFTKGGIELADETVYKLAVSSGELTEEMKEKALQTECSPTDAIKEYVREMKTVNAENIKWE